MSAADCTVYVNGLLVYPHAWQFERWVGMAEVRSLIGPPVDGWLDIDFGQGQRACGTVSGVRRERRGPVDCIYFDGFEPVYKPIVCIVHMANTP